MQPGGAMLTMTVAEIVARDPAAARILAGYRIDLCRSFALGLGAAARRVGVDPDAVVGALHGASHASAPTNSRLPLLSV